MKTAVLIAAAVVAATSSLVAQQANPKNVREGVYTADQALRGKSGTMACAHAAMACRSRAAKVTARR